jgi:hypothetical protein
LSGGDRGRLLPPFPVFDKRVVDWLMLSGFELTLWSFTDKLFLRKGHERGCLCRTTLPILSVPKTESSQPETEEAL